MKRDMDLVRLILLKIEDEYHDTYIYGLTVEGYDLPTVAYHCDILHDAGYISYYEPFHADDELQEFKVGALTWAGNEYLEKIRDNSRWGKIKRSLIDKGLPFTIDMVKMIADAYIGAVAEAAVKGIMSGHVDN